MIISADTDVSIGPDENTAWTIAFSIGTLLMVRRTRRTRNTCAVGESYVILLHPPLPLAGVSIAMERERQQNDSTLAGG